MSDALVPLDLDSIRAQFPALARTSAGRQVAYLDGPGGTQVPGGVIEAMGEVLRLGVSNLGGHFDSSGLAETVTADGRAAGRVLQLRPERDLLRPEHDEHHLCGESRPVLSMAAG
jgi:selenocysteine lyase/cysteine desulfurase